MALVADFYRSTVGKKVVMALTGLVLVGFVIGHMAGNLKMFAGFDALAGDYKMDLYAVFLREIGAMMLGHGNFLWLVRVGLLLCVILHVVSAVQLSAINARAKAKGYVSPDYGSSTVASRSMKVGGVLLLLFIIYHILHFTTGHAHTAGFVHGQVYANVYNAFQSGLIVAIYCVAMLMLGLHLYHGIWSMCQTLGLDTPRWNCGLRALAKLIAIVVCLGFIAVPVCVKLGCLKPAAAVSEVN